MNLQSVFDECAPSATAAGGAKVPSEKALRKRPMTAAQLQREYEKMPRQRSGYDSDDDAPVRCGTPTHVRQARAAAVANLENIPPMPALSATATTHTVLFRGLDNRSPATVEREWEEDLQRALAREAEEAMREEAMREDEAAERELFGEDYEDGTDDGLYDGPDDGEVRIQVVGHTQDESVPEAGALSIFLP